MKYQFIDFGQRADRQWRSLYVSRLLPICSECLISLEGAADVVLSIAKIAAITGVACVAVPAVLTAGLGLIGFGALGPVGGM